MQDKQATEDNSHAGQGPVVLDIGGDIGAVILRMPASLAGAEIEARPVSGLAKEAFDAAQAAPRTHHEHGHGHPHTHPHAPALVHVGVVGRPAGGAQQYSAVFGELQDGEYELYVRPDGPVQLTVAVRGGEVTTTDWPGELPGRVTLLSCPAAGRPNCPPAGGCSCPAAGGVLWRVRARRAPPRAARPARRCRCPAPAGGTP